MANEVTWAGIESTVERDQWLNEIMLALTDMNYIPNHPAIVDAGDISGTGSDAKSILKDSLNGSGGLASIAETGSWANTAYTPASYSVAAGLYYRQYTLSDFAAMIQAGNLSVSRFVSDFRNAEGIKWTSLIAALSTSFTALTAIDSGTGLDWDHFVDAVHSLDAAYNAPNEPKMAILSFKQVHSLQKDAEFTQASNAAVSNPEALAIARTMGGAYVGRYLGVDIFKSGQVPTASSNDVGLVFCRGAIAKLTGAPVPNGAGSYIQLDRLLIEQERDPLGPRAAIRAKTAMGVAAWDTSRGIKLLSDS